MGVSIGFILNLRIIFNEKLWEIEIWFLKDISSYRKQLDFYKSKLDDKKRMEILELKYKRRLEGKSKFELSSTEIYNDILK